MSLALVVALPFLGALLPGLTIRMGRNTCALVTLLFPCVALALLASNAQPVLQGGVVLFSVDWMPALGLQAGFMLDGLGLFFAGMILVIGILIIVYARFYLADQDPMGRFFAFLLLFQGAMLGIVLSDNILLLLIFWELTSLSSFLLIGYWSHKAEGRQGARMALTVTGGGGLCLIAGFLILGNVAGSYDLSVILTKAEVIQSSPLYLPALILILLGCFAKSAQFPFHFWLPHAMAAPTPVSAYLHSATMVKAGIFLLARLWPVLAGTPEWFALVTTAGLITMLIGAKVAFFKADMKALLAYSTVSHLGLITMLLGFGTKAAAFAALFHILNHATFKAALFLTAGIVDHEAGTRDLTRLGGLRRLMPLTFLIATIAALSMAGIPPLNGFLSKEMMLEEAAHVTWAASPWLLGLLATLGAGVSVAYSLRFVSHGFLGQVRNDYPHAPHDPGPGLWISPVVLITAAVLIGLAPMTMASWLLGPAMQAVSGEPAKVYISHWHGLKTPAIWMSVVAIGMGLVLLSSHPRLQVIWDRAWKPDAKHMFDAFVRSLVAASSHFTRRLHNNSLARSFVLAVLVLVLAGWFVLPEDFTLAGERSLLPIGSVPALIWVIMMGAILATVILHRNRVLALMLVGIIGLGVSVGFAYFSAPDLAITQISVEVVTILLMLLALNLLPKTSDPESSSWRRGRDAVLACIAGLGMTGLSYALMTRDAVFPLMSEFHLAQSKPGAGGTNAVNTIIVDFRGFDTYGEIIVLGIAGLIIFALVETLLRSLPARKLTRAIDRATANAGDPHPMMMVVAARIILPLAMLVGVYIYLRGHNMPGGGFVAGLIFAIAIILQFVASGLTWGEARQRFDFHLIIAAGVIVASLCGMGAWLFGLPFLTSGYSYVEIWPLEKFELATAAIFDLGVFLCVLGAVMLTLASFARLAATPVSKEESN